MTPRPEPGPEPRSAGAVRLAVPALERTADITPVDEGGGHSTWWVGSGHVLRLALDRDGSHRQAREIALRELIRRHTRLPLPASSLNGFWAPGLSFTLDTRLRGVSAERRPVAPAGEDDLAGLLSALRSLSASTANGPAGALDLPRVPRRDEGSLYAGARAAAERLGEEGVFPRELLPRPEGGSEGPVAGPREEVLLHNDLKGEHLLVTPEGRISGVIDWADAALGDPAEDIAGLSLAVGAPAALRIAVRAGYGAPAGLRGLRLARADTLIRLCDRLHGTDDSPLGLLRAQRARAWWPTPLDS
ncbi:aminoglycoside phosphotransferase family protein [Streptomyces sp. NPDC001889]